MLDTSGGDGMLVLFFASTAMNTQRVSCQEREGLKRREAWRKEMLTASTMQDSHRSMQQCPSSPSLVNGQLQDADAQHHLQEQPGGHCSNCVHSVGGFQVFAAAIKPCSIQQSLFSLVFPK